MNTVALEHTLTKRKSGAIVEFASLRTYSHQAISGNIIEYASIRTNNSNQQISVAIAKHASLRTYYHQRNDRCYC